MKKIKPTILVVEDETIIALDMREKLGTLDYDVVGIATSGEEAIEKATLLRPELILMDIIMPGKIDGIAAARVIKDELKIPFIYMTANADKATVERARDTEPFGYLNKPIHHRDLFTTIDSAIHKSRMERRLRESEEKYRRLVEEISDIVYSIDERGEIVFISSQIEPLTGYRIDEIIGTPVLNYIYPDDRTHALMYFGELKSGNLHDPIEYRIMSKTGFDIWVRVSGRQVMVDGKLKGVRGILTDITAEKLSGLALKNSERRLHDIISFLPDATFAIDPEGNVIVWNRAIEEMTGIRAETMVGKGGYEYALPFYGIRRPILIDYVMDPNLEISAELYSVLARDRQTVISEISIDSFRSRTVHLWAKAALLFDQNGNTIGAIESIRDITEQKEAEQSLRESESKYRTLIANLNIGVFRTTADGKGTIIQTNTATARMLGFNSIEEILSRPVIEQYFDPQERILFLQELRSNGSAKNRIVTLRRKDGIPIQASVSATVIYDDNGNMLWIDGVIEDVTERKAAELALLESEEKFRTFVEHAPVVIMIHQDNFWIYANHAAEMITGYTRDELYAMHFWEFVHPDDRDLVKDRGLARLRGENPESAYEFRILTKDGKEKWIDFRAETISIKGKMAGMVFGVDITRRKEMESAFSRSQYRLETSIAEKETLIREVHHRVKNNLQQIMSLLNLRSRSLENAEAASIIREYQDRLMIFSIVHEKLYIQDNLSRIDVNGFIRHVVMAIRQRYIDRSRDVELDIDIGPVSLDMDRSISCGLILNELVSNAFKYAFPAEHTGLKRLTISLKSDKDGFTELIVADSGKGLPESIDIENADSLGFSLLPHLVRQIDANLELSREGGTRFTISFVA